MNKIFIDSPEKRFSNFQEDQFPTNAQIRVEIGNKAFRIGIHPDKDGISIVEVSGELLTIAPTAGNAIKIF